MIVDDHRLVREGFAGLIDQLQGVDVVAQAADAQEALDALEDHPVDLALTDVGLPGLNGLELCGRIVKGHPRCRVIMLSMHADAAYVGRAFKLGARGYLLKSASVETLDTAIRTVHTGRTYLCPSLSPAVGQNADDPLDRLTERQREILQLVAEGMTTKEIANHLDLSIKTVETHRSNIMARLDIHDLAGLVRFAVERGVVLSSRG